MLKRFVLPTLRLSSRRCFSAENEDPNSGSTKGPKAKDVLDENILKAVDSVANDLHPTDAGAKKSVKSTLLTKLISHEKATFDVATAAQSASLVDDEVVQKLLLEVASDSKKTVTIKPSRTMQARNQNRGLILLRKEIFYQAKQSGYSSERAQLLAEKAVEEAYRRIEDQRKNIPKTTEATDETAEKRTERDQVLFEKAYALAEKLLHTYDSQGPSSLDRPTINVDKSIPNFLTSSKRLGIWDSLEKTEARNLTFWNDWDLRAARISNKSLGPENSFEEQIEWTEQGKQWPYPINNEYMLGRESEVSFMEHVFLERYLPKMGLPKTGPIAHFMELVCVGLSKNPYMTAEKKMEHLQWFAKFFNAEKQKLVHKLHEQEQTAALNAN